MVYTLSKALHVSPLELYKMPAELFMDMLTIHSEVETMKADEMDKQMKKAKR